MTIDVSAAPAPARSHPRRGRGGGWAIVARKELTDHLLSARFYALMAVLALAAAAAVYSAGSGIRDAAQNAAGSPGLFLKLFTLQSDPIPFSYTGFVGFMAPLVGIALAFDAINGERAQSTLPRLVAQPIHRDDVINGKFVAGLTTIGLLFVVVTAVVAGLGLFRLGIVPSLSDLARLLLWLVAATAYVGVWLALALLCSVLMRRAATSALVGIAVWIVVVIFGSLLAQLGADVIRPENASQPVTTLENARAQENLSRLSPGTLFDEASTALLNPEVRTVGVVTRAQATLAIVSTLSVPQSLLLIWPQLVGMIAIIVVLFAWAYVSFMRQEVRA
jgi:ABC-2 type transport system permease protein